jgi:hypothetical protein
MIALLWALLVSDPGSSKGLTIITDKNLVAGVVFAKASTVHGLLVIYMAN